MKTCLGCKYAEWKKTVSGRLHPSEEGRCTYKYKIPPLPASRYWLSFCDPNPMGGLIERNRTLKDNCAYWTEDNADKEAGK